MKKKSSKEFAGRQVAPLPTCACGRLGCTRNANPEDLVRCSGCNWKYHPDEGTTTDCGFVCSDCTQLKTISFQLPHQPQPNKLS